MIILKDQRILLIKFDNEEIDKPNYQIINMNNVVSIEIYDANDDGSYIDLDNISYVNNNGSKIKIVLSNAQELSLRNVIRLTIK